MTSPLAATDVDDAAVTVAATTDPQDESRLHDLTAMGEDLQHGSNLSTTKEIKNEIMALEEDKVLNFETVPIELVPSTTSAGYALAEPSIPQTPPGNEPGAEFPLPNMNVDMTQIDTLNAMMGFVPQIYDFNSLEMATPLADAPSMDNLQLEDNSYLQEIDQARVSAYAMLEFDDGRFYMNTFSLILGRDVPATHAAMRREADEKRRLEEAEVGPKTPVTIKREGHHYSRSIISESGGILRDGNDSDTDNRTRRRKQRKASRKTKSSSSSARPITRRNSLIQQGSKIEYVPQDVIRRQASHEGPVPVDPTTLRPSPDDCPVIGIHPPASTGVTGYKAISRHHLKIDYNSKRCMFEAEVLGRNGAFVDDEFVHYKDVVPLKSGSILQIGSVAVKFLLPDVPIGQTGAELAMEDESASGLIQSHGGKEMSFEFEERPRDQALLQDTSEEESEKEKIVPGEGSSGEDDDNEGEENVEEDDEDDDGVESGDRSDEVEDVEEEDVENEEEDEDGLALQEPQPVPQKRRGPGRPPKNGIMSKREEAIAKREAKARAAAKTTPSTTITIPAMPSKNKVGRPRKHPLPEDQPRTEKRKYTKRKPKDPNAIVIKEEGDDDVSREKREKKSLKPPRSPTPTFVEAELTAEQIAKPQANYVTLIHEALSNSPSGQMSLPQIYRAIQRKYPFFVLKCNTNGWQSSVRHNLSQHHAFRKVERDGKGWMWAIVDGVSIEKEKKRRPTPPLQPPHNNMHQPIYRAGPPPPPYMMGHLGMMGPPPGYMGGPLAPNGPAPAYSQPNHMMNGYQLAPQPFPPASLAPPSLPASSYSSPYAPKPIAQTSQTQQLPQPQRSLSATPNVPVSSAPIPSAQQPPHPTPLLPPATPQAISNEIPRAIETFKTALVAQLRGKSDNAEAVVASAVNRVLGIATESAVPGDPNEERIMAALRNLLGRLPGANLGPPPQSAAARTTTQQVQQSQSLSANASTPVPASLAKSSTTTPSIQRPSFNAALARPGMGSVPRPPMMTSGMTRTNSGSPLVSSPRLSGAPQTTSNTPLTSDTVTPATHSRPLDVEEASAASPLVLSHKEMQKEAAVGNTVAQSSDENKSGVLQNSLSAVNGTNENGKRQLSQDDDDSFRGRDFKRLEVIGPPPLKA